MSKQVTESLVFRPASELPTAELNGRAVLVFNPCDGWHDGFVRALEEDGEVYHVGIYPWMGSEMLPHDFYITWALLPDESKLAEQFESERRR